MDNMTNNSIENNFKNDNFISRLRRLKIQEGVLTANAYISFSNIDEFIGINTCTELKKYKYKLKESFAEIKNLYEDIKVKTNFRDNGELFEINELKKDILDLESNINLFKHYLRNELNVLQAEEEELMEKINEPPSEEVKITQRKNVSTKCYNEIVPSPVRAIINSPFKCVEVQQYQDFLKNSPYGGWNEYNHNTFIHIWDKYYKDTSLTMESIEALPYYPEFKYEAMRKIPGKTSDDINSHIKWYSQYLSLKKEQQKALNKWQENKRKIKRRDTKVLQEKDPMKSYGRVHEIRKKEQYSIAPVDNRKTQNKNVEENTSMFNKKLTSNFINPTKQWKNRLESSKESFEYNFNIDDMSKLRIPAWRLTLLL